MKTFPAFFLTLSMCSAFSQAWAQSVFPDVPDNHWAAAAVGKLAAAGIVEGYPAVPSDSAAISSDTSQAVQKAAVTTSTIKTAMSQNEALRNRFVSINIETSGKIVTLTGRVNTAAQRNLAARIAANNAKGYKIVNQLKVIQPTTKAR